MTGTSGAPKIAKPRAPLDSGLDSTNSKNRYILVTGVGGGAGRNLCRILDKTNIPVVGVDMRQIHVAGVPCYRVPGAFRPNYVSDLIKLSESLGVSLVIPGLSEEVLVLANVMGRTLTGSAGLSVITAAFPGVRVAYDKLLTYVYLQKSMIPVPNFALPSEIRSGLVGSNRIGWPRLRKLRVSRGDRDVEVSYEAHDHWETSLDDRWLLQEFIPGPEYSCNLYLGGPEIEVCIVLEKVRLARGDVGSAVSVRRVHDARIGNLALAAAAELGLRGPVDVDVRLRDDGAPVVLDVNPRFGANVYAAPETLAAALLEYRGLNSHGWLQRASSGSTGAVCDERQV